MTSARRSRGYMITAAPTDIADTDAADDRAGHPHELNKTSSRHGRKEHQMKRAMVAICTSALLLSFGSPVSAQGNPLRDAYFGETHIHTIWSLDAWLFGNRMTDPGDAYKYFKGETIKHPLGYDIKIDTPLDFAGVTDHSEYVGVMKLANDPSSPISKIPAAQPLILKNDSGSGQQSLRLCAQNHQRRAGRGIVGACIRPRSTLTGDRSTGPTPKTRCATNR
jgi:Protein of unknown function (DUF3604)